MVKEYLKECWMIEPLMFVVKQILHVNHMNQVVDVK